MLTDEALVDPLTEYIWLGPDKLGTEKLDTVARLFIALADALRSLDDFYRNVNIASPDACRDCIFPHVQSYPGPSGPVEFKYLSWLVPAQKSKAIFKARTSDGQLIVVKFTDRYNATAHRLVAEANLAPQLLFISSDNPSALSGGLIMVVMEFVEGETAHEMFTVTSSGCLKGRTRLLKTLRQDVDKAMAILHGAGLVFGDMRAPNIMVAGERAKLVDFDWCGLDGQDRYRGDVNVCNESEKSDERQINWHSEVKRGGVMKKHHDIWMARQLFGCVVLDNSIKEE